ncbi:hypothetical protein ACQJBY_035921 [Aegilops geniculata]
MGTVLPQHQGNGVGDNAMPDLEMGQPTMEIHEPVMEIDQSTIINILHSMLPSASPPAAAQLGRALWGLGSLTLVLALTTVLHLPAAGPVFAHYKAAYYAILAFVLFVAVPVELATAFCLPGHGRDGRLCVFAWVGIVDWSGQSTVHLYSVQKFWCCQWLSAWLFMGTSSVDRFCFLILWNICCASE